MLPTVLDGGAIVPYLKQAMDTLHESLVAHFMAPNDGRGKTGALAQLRGPRRGELRAVLYSDEDTCVIGYKCDCGLYIERQCKHVGLALSFGASWRS
eukprot:4534774-Pyramimonas_sp.AAC.1